MTASGAARKAGSTRGVTAMKRIKSQKPAMQQGRCAAALA